jgi:hypothetical protein
MRAIVHPQGRFGTVTSGIAKAARPGVYKMRPAQAYMHACLMLALGQCAQDIMVELSNLPSMRGKYRANKLQIASEFAQQRKRLLRGVPAEEAERFEAILCDIADNCEKRVRWLIATVRDELTQKVDYRSVEAGALLGITHGIVQCCNRINELMTGKKSCEYNRVLDELSSIDEQIGSPLLNEGVLPDADKCVASLMMLVEDMKESTIEVLGLKREGGAE